ncbi:hypothetical protein KP509_1Z207300 [Ceratopteris richardii]|nr:hypothetical protein KP509_1Z207300 [Ceratopteris richardii]
MRTGHVHQQQQPGPTQQFDHHDSTDTAMVRWLQSAGLQHLASSNAFPAMDPRLLQNLLMEDHSRVGIHYAEDKRKIFGSAKSTSTGSIPGIEPLTPPTYMSGSQDVASGLSSPEFRGEFGCGIIDLHSIEDTELLSEEPVNDSFQASPLLPIEQREFGNESDVFWSSNKVRASNQKRYGENSPMRGAVLERELQRKDSTNGLARIRVVVRKRPLNKKEIARKEDDIVTIDEVGCSLTVHEPKVKVDLTAYVEKHDFTFDAVLGEHVSNDEVYSLTIKPIIPTIFQHTKATCFAYGQTGSGKTYTMQPLPLRACQDIFNTMYHPSYKNQGLQLWLSFFEIYGGKLYDLLNDRRKLFMREDGRQQVCIVGLKEFSVSDVDEVKDYIERGSASRSTGSTGANEESSRSHAILQLVVKKHSQKKDERMGKLVGKFSFIDLAGSERGADTTDNDRQTRIEGAEINKSLLALKECIRALDHEQGHIPFRGSKLTEVLRDSFIGDSRTVMISCISPNTGSCEHTLNTLRYADRVKGLSKSSSLKRDPSPNVGVQPQKESLATVGSSILPDRAENTDESGSCNISSGECGKRSNDQFGWQIAAQEQDLRSYSGSNEGSICHDMGKTPSSALHGESSYNNWSTDKEFVFERSEKEIPPYVSGSVKDEKQSKLGISLGVDQAKTSDDSAMMKQGISMGQQSFSSVFQGEQSCPATSSREKDLTGRATVAVPCDSDIAAILEEEDLIAAHRLEVEDTIELVHEVSVLAISKPFQYNLHCGRFFCCMC